MKRTFQKRFFWLKCSYQFLENSFHTFAKEKKSEFQKKFWPKSEKIRRTFQRSCWLYIILFVWTLRKQFRQIRRTFFAKSREKNCSNYEKKTIFKILLFSSKWSSEHVGTRFDSFVENSEPHVRKVLLKVRLHNEKKKNWKSLFLQHIFEDVENRSDNLSVDFLPKVRKCFDLIPKNCEENFSKKIFLVEVFVSVLRKQFSHFCKRKEIGISEKVLAKIRKDKKNFSKKLLVVHHIVRLNA